MKKKLLFLISIITIVVGILLCTSVFADVESDGTVVSSSWATSFEGTSDDSKISKGYEERLKGGHAVGEFDATGVNNSEGTFTGIGYFPGGITFKFDKTLYTGEVIKSRLVKNPNQGKPDLSLREVTWDGDSSPWIGEGVEVYAVNYNGTGKDELVAIAYNKTAQKRLDEYNAKNGTTETLRQVEGSKVDFIYPIEGNRNVYSTDIYFPEEFQYCDAIKLVDITESLKIYGGQGQDRYDGYDLDAIFGYVIRYDSYQYSVRKDWDHKSNTKELPTSVTVKLVKKVTAEPIDTAESTDNTDAIDTTEPINTPEIIDTKILTPDDNDDWIATFKEVPKYDNKGHIIEYKVIEELVAGYKLTYNELEGSTFVLKNEYVEPTVTPTSVPTPTPYIPYYPPFVYTQVPTQVPTATPTVEPSEENVIEITEEPVLGPTQADGELVTATPSAEIENTGVEGTDEITGDEEETKLLEAPKISESLDEDVATTSSTDDMDSTPETKDINNMPVYIFTLFLSVCGILVLIYRKNRA